MLGIVFYSALIFAFYGGVVTLSPSFCTSNRSIREAKFLSALIIVSVIHLLVLLHLPLMILCWFGMVLGHGCLLRQFRRGNIKFSKSILKPSRIVVGFLVLMFLVKSVCEGISGWDARSIYFFHAKVIYFAQNFPVEPWKLQEYNFSHLDYPKLTASLAALISTGIGYWNEYWPKLATGSLLILLHVGIYVLPLKFMERFVIQMIMFSIPGYFLWVGEQDGFLAGFAFLSTLYMGWGLRYQNKLWIQIGLACVFVGMQIKNEGLALGTVVFFVSTVFRPEMVIRALASIPVVLVASPVFLWTFYRNYFGINNDLASAFSKQRILDRVVSWDLFWHDFVRYFFFKTEIFRTLLLAVVILGLMRVLRKLKWDIAPWVAILSFLGYSLTILCVYLSTPWEVVEHLKTSVDRVAFTPALVLLGAVILASPIQPKPEYLPPLSGPDGGRGCGNL